MIALKPSDNYEIYKDVARNNPGIYIKDYTASQVMGLIGELQKTKSNEYYSRFGHIERSITQEKLPNTELASHRECVESYLENGRTPSGNNTDLLVSLDTMGYNIKDLNTYREKEVSNALTNYISDNPKMMLTASTSRLKDMIDHGQSRELQTIAQKVDGFDDLIAQKLKEIGNIKEAGKPEVTELQTLLSLSGYSTGNINGIAAKRTIDDIYEYKLDSGIIKKPAFSVAVFFKDAAETPQIGTTRVSAHNKYYDEHTNGFGVSQMAIERVWAGLTGNDIQDKGTTPEDSAANNPRPLVMIDLGHGADIHWINERTGKHHHSLELGKGVNDKINFTEAHIVDPLGQALAEKLHRQGYQVAFTRNPGEQLRIEGGHKTTLEARSLFAHEMNKELGANGTIFISLHANAAKNHKTNGTEIYAQQGKHGKGYQNEKSLELAKSVGKNFSIDNKEAQIKHDDFRVLHEFERGASDEKLHASILIETGYITDNKDLKALRKIAEEPDVAAANIAQGVDMFVQENVPELQIAAEAKKSTNCHEIKGGMIDCKINNPSAGQNINL
jgi:N-acetylmuramoyl-L-alanine amidase